MVTWKVNFTYDLKGSDIEDKIYSLKLPYHYHKGPSVELEKRPQGHLRVYFLVIINASCVNGLMFFTV